MKQHTEKKRDSPEYSKCAAEVKSGSDVSGTTENIAVSSSLSYAPQTQWPSFQSLIFP